MANVGINLGSQTSIASDLIGTVNYGISKIDISPFGAAGTLFNGTVGVSSIPQISVGTLSNLPGGTLGSVIGIGSISGLSNLPGGSIVVTTGTIPTLGTMGTLGTVQGLGTLPGIGVVTSLTNGSINIPNGTIQALGTLGTVGTISNVGSLTNIGTLPNLPGGSIAVTAGTINTGTINTGTFVYTGGTLNLIGTTNFLGTIGSIQSIGTLPNILGGTLNNSGTTTGVGTMTNLGSVTNIGQIYNAGTLQAGTISTGTFQINQIPTIKTTSFGTLGTAGAGTVFGTIQGTVGSGTEIIATDWSIVVTAGTPTVSLGFGTSGGSVPFLGTGVIDQGAFAPGGGLAKAVDNALNSGTNGALYYGITAGSALIKVSYQTVATTV